MVWNVRTHARDCRKKTEYLQNNQTSGWSGTDDTNKGKPTTGRGQGKRDKGKGKGKPGKVKGKNHNKGQGKHHGHKGKKGFHEMEGTTTLNSHKPVKMTRNVRM